APGQVGAEELKDHRDQDRLLDGQGFRADGCPHGVGDIVGSNPPGHEKTKDTGKDNQYLPIFGKQCHWRSSVGELTGNQGLQTPTDPAGAIGKAADLVDDVVEKHHVEGRVIFFDGVQFVAHGAFQD